MRLYPPPSSDNPSTQADLVSYARSEAGAVGRSVLDNLTDPERWISYSDFDDPALTQTQRLQNALDAAEGGGLVLPPTLDATITSSLTVHDKTRIVAPFSKIKNTTTHLTLLTLGSNISIYGLELQGAGNSSYNASGRGIAAIGTVGAYKTNILLDDVYVHGVGQAGIWMQFVNAAVVQNCRIYDVGSHGFAGLSVTDVRVTGCHIKGVTPGQSSSAAYNIQFSKGQSSDLGVDPRSKDCSADNNLIEDNLIWEAIDTHCGDNILFFANTIRNVIRGIGLVPLDLGGSEALAPKRCKVILNDIQSINDRYGIAVNGAEAADATTADPAEDCVVQMNTLWNCGPTTAAASGEGAITARHTKRLKSKNNNIYKPGNHGTVLYKHNYDFDVGADTILDPHSTDYGGPSGYLIAQAPQTGVIRPSQLLREDTSAAGTYTFNCVYTVNILASTGSKITIEAQDSAAINGYNGVVAVPGVELRDVRYATHKDAVRCRSSASLGTIGVNFTVSADFKTLTSTTNAVLPAIWDAVTPAAGDTVLYANGTTENGKYVVVSVGVAGSAPWVLRRAPDADTSFKLAPKHWMFVKEGFAYIGQLFQATNTTYPTLGTTTLSYQLFTIPYFIVGQLRSSGSAPSAAAGTGAGTSPTVAAMTGSADLAGKIDITTGTSPAASGTLATITYVKGFGAKPRVILTPANAAAAALSGTNEVYVDDAASSTTAMVLKTGSVALAASTQYVWYWHAIQ